MKRKPTLRALLLVCLASFVSTTLFGQNPDNFETKVNVTAEAAKGQKFNQSCYILYPTGMAGKPIREGGVDKIIAEALREKGYKIVASESDATVFVKVDYVKKKTYQAEIEIKGRPRVDYSNSASSTNRAATGAGGRYDELQRGAVSAPGRVGSMLGPNGEILDFSDQKDEQGNVIVNKDPRLVQLTVYPIALQITAWMPDAKNLNAPPAMLWRVTASHENLKIEDVDFQLGHLAKAATDYFGKSLKKPKEISRKLK